MLIDFSVQNFKSIHKTVTLSAVAQNPRPVTGTSAGGSRRSDDEIAVPAYLEKRNLGLLPVVGIFGANASGKSNVLEALDFLISYMSIGGGSIQKNFIADIQPFRLKESAVNAPTHFELRMAFAGSIYTYTLEMNRTRVLLEELKYVPFESKRLQNRLLFRRTWKEQVEAYEIKNGSAFGNSYRQIQQSLAEYEPFISFGARLEIALLQPITDWVRSQWPGVTLGRETADHMMATRFLDKYDPEMKDDVQRIVQSFDTGIDKLDIEKKQSESDPKREEYQVWVWHKTDRKRVRWPLEYESTGTQRLFSFAYKMLDAFRYGTLLLVDELGSNIHPNITRNIVRLFQNQSTNPNRAQLIFTSHDNTLQRKHVLRRDQIWFTKKLLDGSSELFPLSAFRPRNDLAIHTAYLDGRFGAVPILPEEGELFHLQE